MNLVVLDGYALNPGDLDWKAFEQFGQLTVYDRTPPEQVLDRAKDADFLFTNKAKITADTIENCPNLKYIGELATGFDNIDIVAAKKRSIPVCNIPGYSTNAVAQLTWALILALYNQVDRRGAEVKNGAWTSSLDFTYGHQGLVDLHGKTLALVGLGGIGSAVAKIGQALGMRVIAAVRQVEKYQELGFTLTTQISDCFAQADVLSLHCPLTADNHEMVNQSLLSTMKASAILVNTARGGLIQEQDLANALNQGLIAGAALDVLATEPPKANNPLLSAKNCLITPHVGWATIESRRRLMDIAVANIAGFLNQKYQHVVNGVSPQ
jgi:glycerate dehydrogenase